MGDPAVVGAQRFLQRLWRNVIDEETGRVRISEAALDADTARIVHKTIDTVGRDYAGLSFNTAIARLIELNNALTKLDAVPREAAEKIVLMVAPLAPHIAESCGRASATRGTITYEPFPQPDTALLVEDTVTCVVQIKGKVRDGSRFRLTSAREPRCASWCWRCRRSSRPPRAACAPSSWRPPARQRRPGVRLRAAGSPTGSLRA